MIVSQAQFSSLLKSIPLSTLKMQMGRLRLKFTLEELALMLTLLNQAQTHKLCLKSIWAESLNDLGTYQNFCKNLDTVSKLMPLIFSRFNEVCAICPSQLMNIIDTSLIETKEPLSIKQRDYIRSNVTVRKKEGVIHFICGFKLFCLINRHNLICQARILPINTPDIDVTKNPFYYGLSVGILLADKGFNSALVRKRLQGCSIRLISPFKRNQAQQLTDKEKKLYKRRWKIETAFQKLKEKYGQFKLGASSRYTLLKQKAAILLSLLNYNASLM